MAVTLKIRSRSPKPIQLFIMFKCYIHANLVKIRQLIHEIMCTQAHFGSNLAVKVPQWPWKIGKGHQNQISFHHVPILYPCKSGWNMSISSWDMVHTSTFCLKFGSLSPAVTLKIGSRSPKPNQLFIMSQCYILANLVKIHTPVHEIWCKQESAMLTPMPTPTGSTPKTICPPPLRWGT